MSLDSEPSRGTVARRLNELLVGSGQEQLTPEVSVRFEQYCALLLRWNARTNLTAVRDEEGILRRHFVESIACARAIPADIKTLLDFGSGAGFPGLPIALCRPEITVTLAESQGKKAAFLREVGRVLGISVQVHAGRAEETGRSFDCVTLRAVDRMGEAVRGAARLVGPGGWLAAMTTRDEAGGIQAAAEAEIRGVDWREAVSLPGGLDRILLVGRRSSG
jgi:16S rRNA (guanine527-N7)-methyltransferase